ncbi:kinase-like protein [Biscogniauxia marginata]|nr:kinase-like protein [Biscogniauxia marginata]
MASPGVNLNEMMGLPPDADLVAYLQGLDVNQLLANVQQMYGPDAANPGGADVGGGNLPGPPNDQRPPENFEEHYRAENYRFELYRQSGRPAFEKADYAAFRPDWIAHPYPKEGRVKPRAGKWGRPNIKPYRRLKRWNLLNEASEPRNPAFDIVRKRYNEGKTWFQEKGPFDFVRPLGYGGLGITIQYRYNRVEPALNLVLKIALQGWEDESLRAEEENTRQLSRAAHCIQLIDPERIGLPPKEPFRFGQTPYMDTSDEGESSGEESRGEEPIPRPKTRRQKMQEDPGLMIQRQERLEIREQLMEDQREDRNERLNERYLFNTTGRGSPASRNDNDMWQLDYRDYLLLEFVENGDLANLIWRIGEQKERVPNRVLWSFWLCLISACVAMEYPPRKFHPKRHGQGPDDIHGLPGYLSGLNLHAQNNEGENEQRSKVVGSDLFEDVPAPSRRWAGKRQVHFDIDPRNILIGGLDIHTRDAEHKLVPRLKIADFGCADRIKPNKGNAYYFQKRIMAKHGYFAPEQFGPDWDYVKANDPWGPELSEQRVAGNYGSHTNLWGIALTMWQLITGLRALTPPQQRLESMLEPYTPVTYCALLRDDPNYQYIDPDLRLAIERCMRHEPRLRPSLPDLMRDAKNGIKRVYAGESDNEIRAWVAKMVFNAPA